MSNGRPSAIPPVKRRFGVGTGFVALLALMLFLTGLSTVYLNTTEEQLEKIANVHMGRIELATRMHNEARERTINLQKMILLTDPFERDEQWVQFNTHAGAFAAGRSELLKMRLTPQERELLEHQGKLTGVAVPIQERVVELISQGKTREAHQLLVEKAIPAQNAVLEQLARLYALQKQQADDAVIAARSVYQQARALLVLLSLTTFGLGVIITIAVIRRAKHADAALHQEKERALATLHSIGDGVISTDNTGYVEYLNPVAERLTGWATKDAFDRRLSDIFPIVHDVTREPVHNPVTRALAGREVVTAGTDIVLTSRHGDEHAIELVATPIRGSQGDILGAVLVFRDVTEMRALGREIAHQATHDTLTGLLNRREFEKRLQQALDLSRESGVVHALCHLDLDLFKMVNDSCGHAAGDELLCQVARLLKSKLQHGTHLARLAGDEFIVLIEHCSFDRAEAIAEELHASIHDFNFVWEGRTFNIAASLGVVGIANDTGGLYDAMQAADVACRVAKDEGRNRVHAYRQNDLTILRRQREIGWVQRLNEAAREDRFTLYCQAVHSLGRKKKRPSHYEMLLRLVDNRGVIAPTVFLPAAERYHLMPMIDRWVVHEALTRLRGLDWDALPGLGGFNINLSGQSLYDPEFLPFIVEQIRDSGVPPARLCFEITETAAVTNLASAMRLIAALKKTGCRFALDDFGSGLSSFAYLKNMRVDYLKIDGTFVRNLPDDASDVAMVNSINQVAHAIGIETIAEYVENDAILESVTSLGVDYAQGYALAVPRPLVQVLKDAQELHRYPKSRR
ncbi:MAG: EAL domain-containing protein [Gammaproteobacteria bacterium]|nr:EAL domain-containing protein [Gammaproteobacteria bacterium]